MPKKTKMYNAWGYVWKVKCRNKLGIFMVHGSKANAAGTAVRRRD